ncbi:MAG: sel1 repeat family protein [Proteobacteria bacterium]|nr:sel1 repeat family protein [Pseudomonadota bacterium]
MNGQGAARDYAAAAKWFHLAADQGNAVAQYNLGNMSENELGISKSLVEAYKWYLLAEAGGNRLAAAAKLNLGYRITSQQIAEAESQANEWREAHR